MTTAPNPFVFGLPTPEMSVEDCVQLCLRYRREAPLPKDMAAALLRKCADPSEVLKRLTAKLA